MAGILSKFLANLSYLGGFKMAFSQRKRQLDFRKGGRSMPKTVLVLHVYPRNRHGEDPLSGFVKELAGHGYENPAMYGEAWREYLRTAICVVETNKTEIGHRQITWRDGSTIDLWAYPLIKWDGSNPPKEDLVLSRYRVGDGMRSDLVATSPYVMVEHKETGIRVSATTSRVFDENKRMALDLMATFLRFHHYDPLVERRIE